ncbi:LysM peptidoglycan-binding domain-containing protein [Flavicella sediminum]|uniref:LysM peptidoglycan-binding domain-containing protein n=1 Tax=Flavicella sediminum TaxID=2585141 RepID=UPI0014093B52|nr:LysM peptidoglycan-binding domain-containing protein [Flavicella sediminum]
MRSIFIVCCLLIFTVFSANAQQKKYITYKIKKGESVRKIAKRYDLKSKDIYNLNPDLKRRPKENTVILIPNVNYTEPAQVLITASQNHIVQPKETLFGISKKYKVSKEALTGANPQIRVDGLKIGMVLEIPNNKIVSPEELRKKELAKWALNYDLHTVVKDDTFYSLTHFYKVSKLDLLALNPFLKEGLKLGAVIKIREKIKEDPELSAVVKDSLVETTTLFKDTIVFKEPIDVAFLLPFKFMKNDTLRKELLFSSKGNLENIVTDFYLGAEMAIDSLKEQGAAIRYNAYDTDNDKDCLLDLFEAKALEDVDVVFGPVYNKNVDFVASELKDIPVVYPFYSSKQKAFKKSNVIKTATERAVFEKVVLDHFNASHTSEHVLIVGDRSVSSKIKMLRIKKQLSVPDSVKVVLLQPENNYLEKERFVAAVDTLGVNWVILATNNTVVTADVVNNLKSLPNEAAVKLFAFEKNKNFDRVDNNVLAKMNFTYASGGVLNDSLPKSKRFYEKYQEKNYTYPTEHAIKGFDVVYDILTRMLADEDLDIHKSFNQGKSTRIGETYFYEQNSFSGPTSNKSVYLMKYNQDLSIQILQKEDDKEKQPISVLDE